MDDSEKTNIEIIIGTQNLRLSVPFKKQEFVREVESEIDNLFKTWRQAFPRKDERELLAMIAYQYASYYRELTQLHEEAMRMADKCAADLDNINESLN